MNPIPAPHATGPALLLVCLLAVSCASAPAPKRVDGGFERQMRAGAEASRAGRAVEAAEIYRMALVLAAKNPHQPSRLAYAAWYLGDVCFERPAACGPGVARRSTEQSHLVFAALYGPEHPVVIPILLRLAEIEARDGDSEGAAALVAQADRITTRTFPDSHFMRARSGDHRPAADLDPQELLQILADVDILGG